jgi:hypothetical protein
MGIRGDLPGLPQVGGGMQEMGSVTENLLNEKSSTPLVLISEESREGAP